MVEITAWITAFNNIKRRRSYEGKDMVTARVFK